MATLDDVNKVKLLALDHLTIVKKKVEGPIMKEFNQSLLKWVTLCGK